MWIGHRKEIRKLTFRALALRRSESRNCGLCVVYIQKDGATLLVGACYIDDCISATSSSREDLNQFITAVNSFHPALKYTWEISDTSLAFLDIKVSIEGSGLWAPPRGGCMFPRSLNLFGFYPLFPITKTPCSQKWSQQSSQEFPCSLKIIWKYPLFPENKCYSSRVP